MVRSQFLGPIFVVAFAVAGPALAADPLPNLQADAARVSVSGLSSGAFMAVQYDVAFSASTMGVGVVAGGPYNCAWVNFGGINTCMKGAPSAQASYGAAASFAISGMIDPISNLAKGKVYLFSGGKDSVVRTPVVDATSQFYQLLGVKGGNLRYDKLADAGHAFLSPSFGNACPTNDAPYVNECKDKAGALYDQPGALLGHIHGPLKAKAVTLSAQPVAFDQKQFTSPSISGMAETGYVYIPAACNTDGGNAGGSKCAVHVVFHGCLQGDRTVGDDVYAKAGYNQWADSNRIIVLYPQINPTKVPSNEYGCWDWTGYSGLNFQVKSAAQMSAVNAMVGRLTGAK